jgi:hypothetical protein
MSACRLGLQVAESFPCPAALAEAGSDESSPIQGEPAQTGIEGVALPLSIVTLSRTSRVGC